MINAARLDDFSSGATSPSPSPLAGEGKDEGAFQEKARRSSLSGQPPHPTAAFGDGHLLSRGEKGRTALLTAAGVPAAFFWINLAQRRARRP